jgi:type VI protein secretion system component VasK
MEPVRYLILGAPGAGKTTAFSSLGISGPAGATRNFEFSFAQIDRAEDQEAWELLIRDLQQLRPRRPLDGVLLVVSAADLLELDADQLRLRASALCARLTELQAALRMRVPVYVIVTKCDLVPGFIDWFGTLERKSRDQIFGVTLGDEVATEEAAATEFARSYERLIEQLTDGLIERLRAELDLQRRFRITVLPSQLRALQQPLCTVIRGALSCGGSSEPGSGVLLRGVYLTSATQEGAPIDRLLFAPSSDLALERPKLPANESTGTGFFLADLKQRVLSDIADDVRSSQPAGRSRWLPVACAAAVVLGLAVAAWWTMSYLIVAHEMSRLEDGARRGPDALLPALQAERELAGSLGPVDKRSELMRVGSRTRLKLALAARDAYERVRPLLASSTLNKPASIAVDSIVAPSPPPPESALSQQIAAQLAVPCIQLVAATFPFDRRAARDAPLSDFERLFAPHGTFDSVYSALLAAHVDQSARPWRWVGNEPAPSAEDLERFRSAARIRDAFFARGATQPTLLLTLRPTSVDPDIQVVELDIEGQSLRYVRGSSAPLTLKWSGSDGGARLVVTPATLAAPIEYTGPWALFRLFDRASIQDSGAAGHFTVMFDVGGKHASFEVQSDSGADPFRVPELDRFDCPI